MSEKITEEIRRLKEEGYDEKTIDAIIRSKYETNKNKKLLIVLILIISIIAVFLVVWFLFFSSHETLKNNSLSENTTITTPPPVKEEAEQKKQETTEEKNHAANIKYDFRKIKWGMSKEEIKKSESIPIKVDASDQTPSFLVYSTTISSLDTDLVYYFTENKCFAAVYVITEKHTNENDYIEDFRNLKKSLIEKYGEPETDKIIWKDDLFKDDYSDYGLAISIGDLYYKAIWKTKPHEIILSLDGDNYDISLNLFYVNLPLFEKQNEQEQTKIENII